MEPLQPPLARILQHRWTPRVIDLFATLVLLMAGLICYAAFAGYRTVQLGGLPVGATVLLNGHKVTSASVRLRPGDYDIVITSPTTAPYDATMSVGWLHDITYRPTLTQRSINAIAGTLLGATPETSIAPQLNHLRWFDDNTWAAGLLTPTDTVFVTHYDATKQQWLIAYCDDPAYPNDITALPADVAAYVQPYTQPVDQVRDQ